MLSSLVSAEVLYGISIAQVHEQLRLVDRVARYREKVKQRLSKGVPV